MNLVKFKVYTITDSFKTSYLYETIEGSEAIFAIQKIDREAHQ